MTGPAAWARPRSPSAPRTSRLHAGRTRQGIGRRRSRKTPPDERPNELRLALAGVKALIIFDNLETLPEEERTRLFQFLSRLPEGNKAIVTSRRRSDVDARIVRLDRLSHDEALQLIAELAAKYPRLARAAPQERDDLYAITHGNPFFIRWIAGQLGRDGSQCRTIANAVALIDKAPITIPTSLILPTAFSVRALGCNNFATLQHSATPSLHNSSTPPLQPATSHYHSNLFLLHGNFFFLHPRL